MFASEDIQDWSEERLVELYTASTEDALVYQYLLERLERMAEIPSEMKRQRLSQIQDFRDQGIVAGMALRDQGMSFERTEKLRQEAEEKAQKAIQEIIDDDKEDNVESLSEQ